MAYYFTDLLKYTRDLLRDHAQPPLWSDDMLTGFLNEALDEYAEGTHFSVVNDLEVPLYAGEPDYALPEGVVYVYRVRLDGATGSLAASTDLWTPDAGTLTGTPTRYTTDTRTHSLRFWPTPNQDFLAVLRAAVRPAPFCLDADAQPLPFGRGVLHALADFAAWRSFTHDDADGRNDGAAERAKKRFDEAVRSGRRQFYQFNVGSAARVGGHRIR